ncbi:response regulator of citrate/malate metabolism [Bradyrhizobium sp. USDA 10063]
MICRGVPPQRWATTPKSLNRPSTESHHVAALPTTNRSKVPAARVLRGLTEADRIQKQIIAILKEHEAGAKTADLARKHGISEATIYNWKAKFGGMDVAEARRLKALEEENAKLKKLLAEQMLDAAALRELLSKKW